MLSKGLAICVVSINAVVTICGDDWLADRALEKAVQQPIHLSWRDGSRWELLRSLSIERRIALLLDRRVDPSTHLDCDLHDVDLLGAAFLAVDPTGGEVGAVVVGDLVYVGPGSDGAALPWRLSELKRRVAKLPAATRNVWQRRSTLRISQLARPADVLAELAVQAGVSIEGLQAIPHDLYRQTDLPGLTTAEQFAVLLLGFECWPEIAADGASVRIVPLPQLEKFEWSYPAADPTAIREWVARELPNAKAAAKSKTLQLQGSPTDHFRLARFLATSSSQAEEPAPSAATTVSLKATASRNAILQQVAAKLGVTLVAEGNVDRWLNERVDVDVQRISYADLVAQVLVDTPLRFELTAQRLRIFLP